MNRRPRIILIVCLFLVVDLILVSLWFKTRVAPKPNGEPKLIRFESRTNLEQALTRLQTEGFITDAFAANLFSRLERTPQTVQTGTYELRPGMELGEIFRVLQKPIRQMVRMPETNWARRSANLLAKANVCTAAEYMALVNNPSAFKDVVNFPLPEKSLEGYLYPDTYDFPPLLGARGVILRQLANFEKKVWQGLDQPENLHRVITVASLVELEVKEDNERPIVAGVIENRLSKGMRLQIDAAINYGIQKWRPLLRSEYKSIDSPYNLYRNDGLPPTPICSPTVESIQAALNPAQHSYLYYVAMPSGESRFAATIEQHNVNFRARKTAQRALRQLRQGLTE